MRLRLIIDALAARKGGTAYAAARLAQGLAALEQIEQVIVLTRERSIVAAEIAPAGKLRVELLPRAEHLELPRRLGLEAFGLPRLLKKHRATHLLSWSGMLPRPVPVPVLCHVSNALMFESPAGLNGVRRWAMLRTQAFGARYATPTHAMGQLLATSLGQAPTVIPFGVDGDIFYASERLGREVICVADFYRHKRHDLVLDAWSRLSAPRPPLRLVGDPSVDSEWHQEIAARASRLQPLGEVTIQSGVKPAGMGPIYRRGAVFVLASEHESFNFPLLEAQASGLPTVVRDRPALRETGGPSTRFLAGDRSDEWALAIRRAISTDVEQVRAAAIEHARAFTWARAATTTHQVLVGG